MSRFSIKLKRFCFVAKNASDDVEGISVVAEEVVPFAVVDVAEEVMVVVNWDCDEDIFDVEVAGWSTVSVVDA